MIKILIAVFGAWVVLHVAIIRALKRNAPDVLDDVLENILRQPMSVERDMSVGPNFSLLIANDFVELWYRRGPHCTGHLWECIHVAHSGGTPSQVCIIFEDGFARQWSNDRRALQNGKLPEPLSGALAATAEKILGRVRVTAAVICL